jgi:hypothetical protein
MHTDDKKLYRRANALLRRIDKDQLIGQIQHRRLEEKTQYKHSLTKTHKRKGGNPPVDYIAVELKVELTRALAKREPEPDLVAMYFYPLARLVGF